MSNTSRRKGASFEALVRKFFEERTRIDPRRWQITHRSQSRQPGADLVVWVGNRNELVIECKNNASMSPAQMWRQATDQRDARGGGHPVVIHKHRGQGDAGMQWVTMTLDAFEGLLSDLMGDE